VFMDLSSFGETGHDHSISSPNRSPSRLWARREVKRSDCSPTRWVVKCLRGCLARRESVSATTILWPRAATSSHSARQPRSSPTERQRSDYFPYGAVKFPFGNGNSAEIVSFEPALGRIK